MVGAGKLMSLLVGVPYKTAIIGVGILMVGYVVFGGMTATTWVQIIKAALLLFGVTLLAGLVFSRFGWSPGNIYAEVVARYGEAALQPGSYTIEIKSFREDDVEYPNKAVFTINV